MPRRSANEIVLSSIEKDELKRIARKYTLAYFQVQRAKIVLLAAEGISNNEIAARLDTRREVVWFWRKRFLEKRLAGLEDRDRSGRPRFFPPRSGHGGKGAGL
jgi:transposase